MLRGTLSFLGWNWGTLKPPCPARGREHASVWQRGRRLRSSLTLCCNGRDMVKVRQGKEPEMGRKGFTREWQMTEGVVGPCSPAERGTSCNRLCCAPTGAPWRETSSFDPHPGTPDGVDPSPGKPLTGKLVRAVWTGGKGVSPYLSVPQDVDKTNMKERTNALDS